MSKEYPTLPPNASPLLPSQLRTALNHWVDAHVDSLPGIDSAIAGTLSSRANVNSLEMQDRLDGDPVLISDYLRVRQDDTLTLHPVVSQVVESQYHDELLDELVDSYHDSLPEINGELRELEPSPGYPEPVLDGLNDGFDLAYGYPRLSIPPVESRGCDGREIRSEYAYPIEIHDTFTDLRAQGIVTNLAKSGCEVCGHEAGVEHADKLRAEGYTIHGYAGLAAKTPPEDPLISVQSFDESSWTDVDVVDHVLESAQRHDFRSEIQVEKAGILKQ